MTRTARIGLVVCVLASVILIAGGTFIANADTRRKIVSFRPIDLKDPLCLLGFCLDLKTQLGYLTALGVVAASGSSEVHNLWLINALAVELPLGDIAGAVNSLVSSLYVLEVADDLLTLVDPICPITSAPSIPESYPWGQQQIEVPAVHPGLQGSGVTVAVLDTGIDPTHSEFIDILTLESRVSPGYNALAGGALLPPIDDHGHGTHMAGIIAANLNSSLPGMAGIIGAAPQATLVPVKVLDHNGAGYVSDVVNGLQWVYDNGIRLVNMSFGFTSDSTPLRQAIQSLYNKSVIMVASAGNRCTAAQAGEDGDGAECLGGPATACTAPLTAITYPAAYPWVLAVGSTDIHNHVTAYSLSGPQLDVVAPGGAPEIGALDNGQILSTNIAVVTPIGLVFYGVGHGTSHAAAHVTGALALALQLKPGLSFAQASDLLNTTAVDLGYPREKQGAGRLDVENMLEALP